MSDQGYVPNPPRGCGKKKEGGFYLEAEGSPFGTLQRWVNIFGTGLESGTNPYAAVPPRRTVYGNLAASLILGEFVSADVPVQAADMWAYFPALQELYATLLSGGCGDALFDHVGSKHYTPYSFHREVLQYGPSRRVTPQLAEELALKVPIPVVFTHSRIPVFPTEEARGAAVSLMEDAYSTQYERLPTWLDEGWGLYARNTDGYGHFMEPLLAVMDQLDGASKAPDTPFYQDMNAALLPAQYVEQAFGASWITKVTYVHKADEDKTAVAAEMNRKGIQTLDLAALDEEVEDERF